jgi:hypothetical protein
MMGTIAIERPTTHPPDVDVIQGGIRPIEVKGEVEMGRVAPVQIKRSPKRSTR